MHKDANLRKRNALVIPGGLLIFYGFVGLAYAMVLRSDAGTCSDAALVFLAGACRSVLIVVAIPLVLGLGLIAAGALGFRNRATCRAGHGSWTHFGFALLLSVVLVPLLVSMVAPSILGTDPSLERGGVRYPVSTIMAVLSGFGLLSFIPFVLLYYGQARANPCCGEKGCFDPCFCDEAMEPAEPMPEPVAEPAPAAPEETAPLPAAAASDTAPAGDWQVVPEEPAAPATSATGGEWVTVAQPATAAAPAVLAPEPAASPKAPSAPALASRPSDPAARPADEMAMAAKWAEEDEDASHDLEGSDPPTPHGSAAGTRRRARKTAKASAKADKKAAKAKKKR